MMRLYFAGVLITIAIILWAIAHSADYYEYQPPPPVYAPPPPVVVPVPTPPPPEHVFIHLGLDGITVDTIGPAEEGE
jgi:hypothetical protein